MSAGCNTCYLATTQPEWVARIVTNMREDKPCERHRKEAVAMTTDNRKNEPTPEQVEAAADAVVTEEMIAETILKALVFTNENSKPWADGLARDIAALFRGGAK